MTKNTATIRSIFTGNPDAKQFYFTSDEQGFVNERDAKNHGLTLKSRDKDGKVTLITRDEAFAEDKATEGAGGKPSGNGTTEDGAAVIGKTAQEQLEEAQKAYDAAVGKGDVTEITNTKKALSTAKARVTREANKG